MAGNNGNGFKPGQKRPPGGGRKAGTPNRDKQTMLERAQSIGRDPFEILCMFANAQWKELGYAKADDISPELRNMAAKEACQYIHPKRKAVEHSGKDGAPVAVTVTPIDLEERKRQLLGESEKANGDEL